MDPSQMQQGAPQGAPSLPPELLAALSGGGAPPPDSGGMPPGLMEALMAGGGGGGGADPTMQGPPPAPADQADPAAAIDDLKSAIEKLQAALAGEKDDQDSQVLAKVIADCYKILADRQKEQDSAMGGSNQRLLRRLG